MYCGRMHFYAYVYFFIPKHVWRRRRIWPAALGCKKTALPRYCFSLFFIIPSLLKSGYAIPPVPAERFRRGEPPRQTLSRKKTALVVCLRSSRLPRGQRATGDSRPPGAHPADWPANPAARGFPLKMNFAAPLGRRGIRLHKCMRSLHEHY